MTCWYCKYHKPVSVAFSFCKLKKRGISFMDIPKGCPSFRPETEKTSQEPDAAQSKGDTPPNNQ